MTKRQKLILKRMITDELVNHMTNKNITNLFPNMGKNKWAIENVNGVPQHVVKFEYGVIPQVRVQWSNSYFFVEKKVEGKHSTARMWFCNLDMINDKVVGSEAGMSGWLATKRYDDVSLPNIPEGEMKLIDVINFNKMQLLLKCNWTFDMDISSVKGGDLYIKSGRFIDGEFAMPIDWVSFMRDEKLKELGL